jgi:hypothetical protein
MNTQKNTTREQLARAILSQPRNYYAAQDGIKLAENMLELWDEYASEFPEIVEATQYFSAPVRPNCMAVRYVEENKVNENTYLWLDLKTSNEERQCCFFLEDGCWIWDSGEFMPDMSPELEEAWYYADPIIHRLRETRQTCFISA